MNNDSNSAASDAPFEQRPLQTTRFANLIVEPPGPNDLDTELDAAWDEPANELPSAPEKEFPSTDEPIAPMSRAAAALNNKSSQGPALDLEPAAEGSTGALPMAAESPRAHSPRSHTANSLPAPERLPCLVGDYLAPGLTVLFGPGAGALALAIAEAVATGSVILGSKAEQADVLFVDPAVPTRVMVKALTTDQSRLDRLRLLSAEDGADYNAVQNEVVSLATQGTVPKLVVVNNFERYRMDFTDFGADRQQVSVLLVSHNQKHRYSNWKNKVGVVDFMTASRVIKLQPYSAGIARLTTYEYGAMTSDLAVEPGGAWEPKGKPDEGVRSTRQAAVLQALEDAGNDGLEPKEAAALLDMTPGNTYQALLLLKRADKIFKSGARYFVTGATPAGHEENAA